MTLHLALLLAMTFLGSVGSLFFKRASGHIGLAETIKDVNLYIGGFLYLGAAALNIIVLRKLDYSTLLPLTSLTYIWTMAISYIVLREKITKRKIWGVALIVIGAICVSSA